MMAVGLRAARHTAHAGAAPHEARASHAAAVNGGREDAVDVHGGAELPSGPLELLSGQEASP